MAEKDNDKNQDDFALFRDEVRDAKPIHHDNLIHDKPKPEAKARSLEQQTETFSGETFSDMYAPETVGNEEYLSYRGDGIQHKQFAKLRAGKIHIEAELDLHGLTLAKAEPTLSQFLTLCQAENIRYVRIIHGKGLGSKENKPILKSKLNHWLRQSEQVLAFCSANIEDGGTGALYVLLKRHFND